MARKSVKKRQALLEKLPKGGPGCYPNTLLIGDNIWQVKFVRRIDNSQDVYGICDPSTKTIYIRMKQSRQEAFYTLIHEVIHAIEDELEVKLKHSVVHQLEKGLGDFLIENCVAMHRIVFGDGGKAKGPKTRT